jgi:hypothetical protein
VLQSDADSTYVVFMIFLNALTQNIRVVYFQPIKLSEIELKIVRMS